MTNLLVDTGWILLGIVCLLGGWVCYRFASRFLHHLPTWHQHAPSLLEPGMKLEIVVKGQTYRTALWGVEKEILWLLPPLQSGIPVRFLPQTPIVLRLVAPGGLFSACTVVKDCKTQPQSLTGLAVPRRWTCEQRRLYPRVTLPEEVPAGVEVNEHHLTGWLQDLSAGGARLHTLRALAIGDPITLNLHSSETLMPGTVIDCRRVLHNTTYEYEVRVAFETPQTLSLCAPSTSP